MDRENPAVPVLAGNKATLIPVLICAGACVILMRAGFLSFFFLVPLGFCAVVYGSAAAWLSFVYAALGNAVISAGITLFNGAGLVSAGLDILYFTILTLGFTWVMANSPPENNWIPDIPRVRTLVRFIAASLAAALLFLGVILARDSEGGFSNLTRSQIETISSGFIASSGADAAQQSMLERSLTADRIIEVVTTFTLRGGALVSAVFLFFFSRQTAFVLTRLFRRQRKNSMGSDLIGFHVPRKAIWALSLCLPGILLSQALSITVVEVVAWNVLVMCVIMFLAQGGGIVLFMFASKPIPGMVRLLFIVALVFMMFSPGINVMALGALVLLGIAETWLPLRAKKKDIPAA